MFLIVSGNVFFESLTYGTKKVKHNGTNKSAEEPQWLCSCLFTEHSMKNMWTLKQSVLQPIQKRRCMYVNMLDSFVCISYKSRCTFWTWRVDVQWERPWKLQIFSHDSLKFLDVCWMLLEPSSTLWIFFARFRELLYISLILSWTCWNCAHPWTTSSYLRDILQHEHMF